MRPKFHRFGVLGVAAVIVSFVSLVGVPPAGAAVIVDATPEPSWHVDGVVNATVVVGDTVLVGGTFANVVSPGGATLPRTNLAAFSLATGEPLTGWRLDADNTVRAFVSDGTSVWVGGSFRTLGGRTKNRIAKIDAATGAIDPAFTTSSTNTVRALALRGGALYLGGNFGTINNTTRPKVAKVSAATGALDATFVANPDNTVLGFAASPTTDDVFIAGSFLTVNGDPRTGVAALNGTTGATRPTVFGSAVTTLGLDISPDGTLLYGAVGGSGNAATAWNTTTGVRLWRVRVDGDVQAVRYHRGTLYFGFHDGFEGDQSLKLLAADAANGALDPLFRPTVTGYWGVFTIAASPQGVVVGGDFTAVGGTPARSMAIFRADRPVPVEYVAASTSWRYLDQGVRPDGWQTPAYDDTGWASGLPQLGYGDGDETTLLSYGPSETARYLTAYFRTTFQVTGAPTSVTLQLAADDGAVVYLNGVELLRDNMPAGTITNTTRATASRSGTEENLLRSFVVDPSLLAPGTNTLAVELHQASNSSATDASFDARLSGLGAP